MDEQPEGRVSINAERIRDLVCRADNDSEQGGALTEYLVDNALDIAGALGRVPELERDLEQADEQIGFWQRGFSDQEQRAGRAEAERDNARQALDRQVDQLAAVLGALPPPRPGTALGLPVHQQVRDLRQRVERLEAALEQCWMLMDSSEGRIAEALYGILEPLRAPADVPESGEASDG